MQTLTAQVLDAWRDAERLSQALRHDTPEHASAVAACERLRGVYQAVTRWDGWTAEDEARRALSEFRSRETPGGPALSGL